jgi:AcrR family transcriptional regulator
MPAPVDRESRRRDVAEAVWRVLESSGFAGLSMRSVAAEMGATTGLVTHWFGTKDELVDHALGLLHERTDASLGEHSSLRSRLLAVLPTTDEGRELSRIWVGFWGLALVDAGLSAREAARYERWRAWLRPHVPSETAIDLLTSSVHGLVVQALFDPARFPPARLEELVDVLLVRQPTVRSST